MGRRKNHTQLQERLAVAIRALVTKYGGYLSLEREFHRYLTSKAQRRLLSRKRLRQLADRSAATLSFLELDAIHTVLQRLGYAGGLRSLLSPSLAELLSDHDEIQLIVSTKPHVWGDMAMSSTSHWDLKSIAELTGLIYRQRNNSHTRVVISDIPLLTLDRPSAQEVSRSCPNVQEVLTENATWRSIVDGRSILVVGSPRANHASEYLLAKMFDIPPFMPPEEASDAILPFRFEWSPGQFGSLQSSFATPRTANHNDTDDDDWRTSALWIGDKRHEIERNNQLYDDFGVIVAQRRQDGGVWICFAGSGGPATYAIARQFGKMTGDLPVSRSKQGQAPLLWAAVCARVRHDPAVLGDNRQVFDENILEGGPAIWP